jgi:hypothetical protein
MILGLPFNVLVGYRKYIPILLVSVCCGRGNNKAYSVLDVHKQQPPPGVKFWMLVESVTGYVLQMTVYQGKRFDPTPVGTLQGTNIVINSRRGF